MSEFHCRELLLPYVQGELPPETVAALETTLAESPTCQGELESLKKSLSYVEELSELQYDPRHVESMVATLAIWTKVRSHLSPRTWPDGLKITLEAGLILGSLFLAGLLIPWDRVKDQLDIHGSTPKAPAVYYSAPESSSDENVEAESIPAQAPTLAQKEPPAAPAVVSAPEPPKVEVNPKPEVVAEAPKEPVPTTVAAAQDLDPVMDDTEGSGHEPEPPPGTKPVMSSRGEVYKLFMDLANLDVITPEIADRIRDLGGKKAGQVPLGWRRAKGSYFHFSINEDNYEALQTMLKEYGSLRIIREPHTRVMPLGVKRVILWIERVPSSSQPNSEKDVSSGDDISEDESGNSSIDHE